jgi:ubiquinone/menaquinone biosynthesis C-methylase UbiE
MPENHMDELYNSKNILVRFAHTDRLNAITKIMGPGEGLKVLDAGCGEGHLLEKLRKKSPKNTYYGIDITDVALKRAKERCPGAKIKSMDVSAISFAGGFFDVVVCTEVLEHIDDYEAVAKELKRVLKKGGRLIITFPNETLWTLSRALLLRTPFKVPDHVNSFSPGKIKQIMGMKAVRQVNLPFRLPFFLSLGCMMEFKK